MCFECAQTVPLPPSPAPPGTVRTGIAFTTRSELRGAVDAYLRDGSISSVVAGRYGYPISAWNVGQITDFSELFSVTRNPAAILFDEDLEGWDLSEALYCNEMFDGARSFTGKGLANWNVRKVRTMNRMFVSTSLQENLDTWNVGNVQDFSFMFEFATEFGGVGLSDWDVQSATNMGWMVRYNMGFLLCSNIL